MLYNRSDFIKHIDENLIPDGFERTQNLPVFYKQDQARLLTIQISTRDYFPHGVYISGVIADIVFHEVEEIYSKVLRNHPLPDSLLQSKSTLSKALNDLQGINYNSLEVEINDEPSFEKVHDVLVEIIEYGAMPLFDKLTSVTALNQFTKQMKIEEIASLIGQPMPFRQMIIKKLSNDVSYSEYSKTVIDFSNEQDDTEQLSFAQNLDITLREI